MPCVMIFPNYFTVPFPLPQGCTIIFFLFDNWLHIALESLQWKDIDMTLGCNHDMYSTWVALTLTFCCWREQYVRLFLKHFLVKCVCWWWECWKIPKSETRWRIRILSTCVCTYRCTFGSWLCIHDLHQKISFWCVCVMYMGSALFLYTYNGPSSHGTLYWIFRSMYVSFHFLFFQHDHHPTLPFWNVGTYVLLLFWTHPGLCCLLFVYSFQNTWPNLWEMMIWFIISPFLYIFVMCTRNLGDNCHFCCDCTFVCMGRVSVLMTEEYMLVDIYYFVIDWFGKGFVCIVVVSL